MLIGELSKQTGLSRDTIRFYEKQGLITAGNSKSPYNNYKEYSNEAFKRLQTIKRIKDFGFTLNEVAGFLEMIEAKQASCKNVSEKINAKVLSIEEKINALQKLKALIVHEVENCPSCTPQTVDETCPIFA